MTAGKLRPTSNRLLNPVLRALAAAGVSPNLVTVVGFSLSLAAAGLILAGFWPAAGVVFWASGLTDLLDGGLARLTGRTSRFGAFLDSTLDRLSEAVVLGAAAYEFGRRGDEVGVGLAFGAAAFGLLTSYARARAEGLGLRGDVGVADRGVRVVLLGAGLVAGPVKVALGVLTLLGAVTVTQRILYVRRQASGD